MTEAEGILHQWRVETDTQPQHSRLVELIDRALKEAEARGRYDAFTQSAGIVAAQSYPAGAGLGAAVNAVIYRIQAIRDGKLTRLTEKILKVEKESDK